MPLVDRYTLGGSIKIGGQDIKEVSQGSLRRSVGVVPQDTMLFNDTIGYNIGYGDLTASEDEVMAVARKAQLDSSIARMPQVRGQGHRLLEGRCAPRLWCKVLACRHLRGVGYGCSGI